MPRLLLLLLILPGLAAAQSAHDLYLLKRNSGNNANEQVTAADPGADAFFTWTESTNTPGWSTSPSIGTLSADSLKILDNVDQSHGLSFVVASDLTADRNLTLTTGDAARALTINGDATLNDWFDQSVKAAATPTFAGVSLADGNGIDDGTNEQLLFLSTGSAITYFTITNAATGNPPILSAAGETNTSLSLQPAGTGNIILGDYTLDGDQTLGAGQDNYVLTFDNGTGLASFEAAGAGSPTAFDDIADPDAASTITFADTETVTFDTASDGETFFTLSLSDSDLAADTTGLLITAVDNDDANYIPLLIQDDQDGTPDDLLRVTSTGQLQSAGGYFGQSSEGMSFNGGAITIQSQGDSITFIDDTANNTLVLTGNDATFDDDVTVGNTLTVSGFAATLGDAADSSPSVLSIFDGNADNNPAQITLYNDGGTASTLFLSTDGDLRFKSGTGVTDDDSDGVPLNRKVRTEFLPVGWFEDGTTAPAALETFADTRKVDIRKFDSAQTEDCELYWQLPSDAVDADTGTANWQLKWRVIFIVTEATGPSTEGVSFDLAGVALADNEDIGAASLGTTSESDKASITAVQNDILYSDWAEITLTGAAAGEGVFLNLTRDHDDTVDTYGQDIGVVGLEFKYTYQSATY